MKLEREPGVAYHVFLFSSFEQNALFPMWKNNGIALRPRGSLCYQQERIV